MLLLNPKFKITYVIDCIQIKLHTRIFTEMSEFKDFSEHNSAENLKYLESIRRDTSSLESYVILDSFLGSVNIFVRNENIKISNSFLFENYNSITVHEILKNSKKSDSKLIQLKNLIKSKILGITIGFISYIQLKGLGFRSQIKNKQLLLRVGLTDLIYFNIIDTIRIKRIKKHALKIYGIDLSTFRTACIKIKQFREPSPYNDRGLVIRDVIRKLKQGKRSKF